MTATTSTKTAAKQPAKTARAVPVARGDRKLPKPTTFDWTTKEVRGVEYEVAEGARHLYRVWQAEDGGWFAAQKLKAGSWSPMAGRCNSREAAQQLAGFNEAGALWLAYRDVVGLEFTKLIEQYG